VKSIHITVAILSLCGFVLRSYWRLTGSAMLARKWVRIVPHAVDTVLLLSGLTMIFRMGISPSAHGWLLAKLAAVIMYIVLGLFALRWAKTLSGQAISSILAVVVFAYIVSVAVLHTAAPFEF
ncbi:MAG: SirB2 family protein, partial [Gammaproteobacteria bacterium]|nr:SirB2 family protein [Gammaproteobacteria bacterium]